MTPIRVVMVDDYPDFLMVMSDVLSRAPSIRVVGAAMSGEEALTLVHDLRPDLVLMDLVMPGINGLDAAHRIKEMPKPPRVVLVTLNDGPEYRARAAAVGADGFLSKSNVSAELLPLIRTLFPMNAIA